MDGEAVCSECMRDPALHPSRSGEQGGGLALELDLDPGPAPALTPNRPEVPADSLDLPPLVLDEGEGGDALPTLDDDDGGASDEASDDDELPLPDLSLEADPGPVEEDLPLPDLAPDLDVAAPLFPSPPTGPAIPSPSSFDADEDDPLDGDLDVGLDVPAAPKVPPASAAELAPAPSAPTSETVPAPGEDDSERIAAVAGYGPAPDNPALWPVYAARIWLRRRELRREVEQGRMTHRVSVRSVLEQQVSIVEPLVRAKSPAIEALLPLIAEADAEARKHQNEVAAINQEMAAELEAIDQKLAQAQSERRQRSRDLEVAKVFREQAQEKLRALEKAIVAQRELVAAAHEAAQKAAPGAEFAPPEHARAILAAEEKQAALTAELPGRKGVVDDAKRKEHERRKATVVSERTLERLARERSRVEYETYAAMGDRRDAVDEAVRRRLETYAEVLNQILQQAPRSLDGATLERARSLRLQRKNLDEQQRLLEAAPDAYDAATFQRGLIALAATGVVVFGIVLRLAL